MQKIIVQGTFKNVSVVLEVEGSAPQEIQTEFDEWIAVGFIPANASPQKIMPKVNHQAAFNAQAPSANCPIHNKPFRQNSKGNFCATKLEDDSWCTENGKSKQRSFVDVTNGESSRH